MIIETAEVRNNEYMKQFFEKMNSQSEKTLLIEKRGPLNKTVDTSIKKLLFVLMLLNPKQLAIYYFSRTIVLIMPIDAFYII
jgi:hypothetical protein